MLDVLRELFSGVLFFFTVAGLKNLIMFGVGFVLIYLAIVKEYEPNLLLPIGFGAILANLPPTAEGVAAVIGTSEAPGFLKVLYDAGIKSELFPILIFIAVGAMIDFTPLLKNPIMIFFGAAAQLGIFVTFIVATALLPFLGIESNMVLRLAASIGIIGAADGPTTLYAANYFQLARFIGPISVAAYSYMSLVPIIQPPVIKALTTRDERLIRMDYREEKVSRKALIIFPVLITVLSGILVPMSAPLVGSLMFGNLIRVCGVLERLSETAQTTLSHLITLLLGITVGSTMKGEDFLQATTIGIMILGLLAFVFDTAGGVLFAKFVNLFLKKKINPMIGAAGISAFPMSARVVQKMATDEDPGNFILMQAISANVAGQLGSIISGGILIQLLSQVLRG